MWISNPIRVRILGVHLTQVATECKGSLALKEHNVFNPWCLPGDTVLPRYTGHGVDASVHQFDPHAVCRCHGINRQRITHRRVRMPKMLTVEVQEFSDRAGHCFIKQSVLCVLRNLTIAAPWEQSVHYRQSRFPLRSACRLRRVAGRQSLSFACNRNQ